VHLLLQHGQQAVDLRERRGVAGGLVDRGALADIGEQDRALLRGTACLIACLIVNAAALLTRS
jgi:hypothetical protein